MTWTKVAEKGTISKGQGVEFEVEGKKIAIFHEDKLYALDALCCHQDGSIAEGKVVDCVVECPMHFWHFDIRTGKLLDYLKGASLDTYPVEQKDDGIYIDI